MLPRVFITATGALGATCRVEGEDGHHYARVLRVKPGEQLVAAMRDGPWLAQITEVSANGVQLRLEAPYRSAEPTASVTLVQGVAKGDKMETVIQKCTEIGAASFIAYQAQRSVVRLQAKADSKLLRWHKVAREAAMQSQRDRVPEISYAQNLAELCRMLKQDDVEQILVLDEAEEATGLVSALARVNGATAKRALLIGPEGGWSDAERDVLRQLERTTLITLGPRILRTETAGAAALAVTLAHFGDMGG